MKKFAPTLFTVWATLWLPNVQAQTANTYYAGNDNPLVRLGAQRVFKTVSYPEWFQYPAISGQARQQLVDVYSTRAFLLSMDRSSEGIQHYIDAGQLMLDLLGTSTWSGRASSYIADPATKREINETLRNKVVPRLVHPRAGFELDAPSDSETDYGGPNGAAIQRLDLQLKVLIHDNHVPTGYRPPASYMSPTEREAFERNQEKIRQETQSRSGNATDRKAFNVTNVCALSVGERQTLFSACADSCPKPTSAKQPWGYGQDCRDACAARYIKACSSRK
jgi:hypothetical protein